MGELYIRSLAAKVFVPINSVQADCRYRKIEGFRLLQHEGEDSSISPIVSGLVLPLLRASRFQRAFTRLPFLFEKKAEVPKVACCEV